MSLKQKYHITRSEQRAFGVLLTVVLLIIAGRWWLSERGNAENDKISEDDRKELAAFEESLRADSLQRAARRKLPAAAELFPFNPNDADSATLLRVGLKPWQVRNLLKYRRKGGRWRSADDFRRLYGLTEEEFQRLRPYIIIPPSAEENQNSLAKESGRRDSLRRIYPEKFGELTVLSLNAANTTLLQRIPGIGRYRAAQICRYRERLGGYISTAQLREIGDLPEGIEQWFEIGAGETPRQIDVNKSDFKTLLRHPYLSYDQVCAIMRFRQKFGSLRSWSDLRNSPDFSETDFQRLAPYFKF